MQRGTFFLLPPYAEPVVVPPRAVCQPGLLICVDATDGCPTTVATDLRARFPWASVGLWTPEGFVPDAIILGLRCQPDFWLTQLDVLSMRRQLTEPEHVATHVCNWIGRNGIRLSELERTLVACSLAPEVEGGDGLSDRLGMSPRTLRRRLRRSAIGGPREFRQLGRLLRAALTIQRGGVTLASAGFHAGYVDYSSLYRATRTAFGIAPSTLKGTIGVGWLLYRWFGRRPSARERPRTPRLPAPPGGAVLRGR